MIKLIFMDIDETLMRDDKTISAYTLDVLARLRARGVRIACATARSEMARTLLPWALFDGGVFSSGALVEVGGRVVYDRMLPAEMVAPLLRDLAGRGMRVGCEIDGLHRANFDVTGVFSIPPKYVRSDFTDLRGKLGKFYVILNGPEEADGVRALLPPGLNPQLNRDNFLMVSHQEAHKEIGVCHAAQAFGIDLAHTAAFGDDVTDAGMLRACGVGVAMANARDEVKAAADEICASNNDDGVARWLEAHILCASDGGQAQ